MRVEREKGDELYFMLVITPRNRAGAGDEPFDPLTFELGT